jgi:hypothetical protein
MRERSKGPSHFFIVDDNCGAITDADCTWDEAVKVASENLKNDPCCQPVIYGPLAVIKRPEVPAQVVSIAPMEEIKYEER